MVIQLAAPFRWDRAVFNRGELVDLPHALALQLVEAGQAHEYTPPVTRTLEAPPANKLMSLKQKKYFASGSRDSRATQGD